MELSRKKKKVKEKLTNEETISVFSTFGLIFPYNNNNNCIARNFIIRLNRVKCSQCDLYRLSFSVLKTP